MAADSAAEIASSLATEDIPIKFRCSLCSKLALEAVRTPCCDSNICETCYETLNEECSICMHTPFDKTLCTPNKTLRNSIKALLKRKATDREVARKKEEAALQAAAAAPPPQPQVDEVEEQHATPLATINGDDASTPSGMNGTIEQKPPKEDADEDEDNYEPAEPRDVSPAEVPQGHAVAEDDDDNSSNASDESIEIIVNHEPEPYVEPEPVVEPQSNTAQQQSFGNASNNSPNANALQGMNPATMMAAMAAMGGGFGQGFPMAPMGMDMNLMAQMAQMMNNMGAMGMNLNGMIPMNMGFNTSQFDQWGNSGRHNGYNNNQQFNNHGYQNDYSRNGYRGRGRGRGRGGYNSFQNNRNDYGGFNPRGRENFSAAQQDSNDAHSQQVNERSLNGRRGSPTYESKDGAAKDDEGSGNPDQEIREEAQELKREDATSIGEGDVKKDNQAESEVLNDNVKDISNSRADISVNVHAVDEVSSHAHEAPGNADIQSQQAETTNGTAANQQDRFLERNRSYDRLPTLTAPAPPVIPGAPTGPRALREGGRGRGGGWGYRGRGGFEHVSRTFSEASPLGAGRTSTDTTRNNERQETPNRSPQHGHQHSRKDSRDDRDGMSKDRARVEEIPRNGNEIRGSNSSQSQHTSDKAPTKAIEEDEIDYGYDDDEEFSKPEPRARSKHDRDEPSRRNSRHGGDAANDDFGESRRRESEHRSSFKARDREREAVDERSHRYHDRERYEPRSRDFAPDGEKPHDRDRADRRRESLRERERGPEDHRRRDSSRAKNHDRDRDYEDRDRDRRTRHSNVQDSNDTTRTGTPRSARFDESQTDSGRRKRRAREYEDEEPTFRDERDESRERHGQGRRHGRDRERDRERPSQSHREREREKDREPRERERKRSRREEPDRMKDDDIMADSTTYASSRAHPRDRDEPSKPLSLSERTSRPSLSIRASATKAIPSGPRSSLPSSTRDRDREPPSASSVPEKDPHTLEREARNRERLAKEMQRRAVAGEMSLSSRTGGRDRDRDRDGEGDMGTWIRGRSSRTARLH